jgi:hypothetical protein
VLSPKKSQIDDASDVFGQTERDDWLPVLVGSRTYRTAAQNFGDVDTKLAAIQTGTRKAKQLNAAMKLIDRIGPIDAASKGVEGDYSTLENREGFIEYALSILYGAAFQPRFLVPGSSSVRNFPRW